MKSFEFYQERMGDSLKEGLSHEKGSESVAKLLEGLSKEGKYQKMTSLIRIIGEFTPSILSDKILEFLNKQDLSQLPFDPDKLNFKDEIGKGGEHKVFLLESTSADSPSYVLKINCQNHGSLEKIQKKAVDFKNEYEEISQKYKSIPGIVPSELTTIIANPRNGKPIMATVQKYFGQEIKDLINDFNKEELIDLLINDPELLEDFHKFYEIMKNEYTKKGITIDLLGDKNLSIVSFDSKRSLLILDPHSSISKAKDDQERIKRQENRVNELKEIFKATNERRKDL